MAITCFTAAQDQPMVDTPNTSFFFKKTSDSSGSEDGMSVDLQQTTAQYLPGLNLATILDGVPYEARRGASMSFQLRVKYPVLIPAYSRVSVTTLTWITSSHRDWTLGVKNSHDTKAELKEKVLKVAVGAISPNFRGLVRVTVENQGDKAQRIYAGQDIAKMECLHCSY